MKAKTEKAIVESFTLLPHERIVLRDLEKRYPNIKPSLKKSEAVRIGLKVFGGLSEKRIQSILVNELGRLVVGRPPVEESEPLTISSEEWKKIRPLVPSALRKQGTKALIEGIVCLLESDGERKPLKPDESSCRNALERWQTSGIWATLCAVLLDHINSSKRGRLATALLKTFIPSVHETTKE